MSQSDSVNHPTHYGGDTVYEHIKVVEAWELGYELGNATKYICRAGKKDAPSFNHTREDSPRTPCPECKAKQGKLLEDLRKARWYLDYYITRMELRLEELHRTD